jgi:hypothetical protein
MSILQAFGKLNEHFLGEISARYEYDLNGWKNHPAMELPQAGTTIALISDQSWQRRRFDSSGPERHGDI